MNGYLHLIIGPMYSSKSTMLLHYINRYKSINKNVLVVNHKINDRYGTNRLITHNKVKWDDCIVVDKLSEIRKEYNLTQVDIIIVEELQFYSDAFEQIRYLVEVEKKHVICAGLDGDFKREPFGDVLRLIPLSDEVTKLSALCQKCGNGQPAIFTQRKTKIEDQTLVGDLELYEAVCRKHYLKLSI